MFKQVLLALALLLTSCDASKYLTNVQLTAEEAEYVHSQVVKVAIEETYPPMIYAEDTIVKGLSKDYLDLITQNTGLRLKYVLIRDLGAVMKEFKAGNIDFATSLSATSDRQVFMTFTSPYVSIGTTMLLKSGPPTFPMTVGYSAAYAVESHLQKLGAQVQLVSFKDDEDLFKALMNEKLGAAVLDSASAKYLEEKYRKKFSRSPVNFQYKLAFGYQPKNQVLGRILEKGLLSITAEQRDAIQKKYQN